jgi:hypothetical protein
MHGAKELNHTPVTKKNSFIFHNSVTSSSVLIILWAYATTFCTLMEHFQTLWWPYVRLSEVPLEELVSVSLTWNIYVVSH